MPRFLDISPVISEDISVWPDDIPYQRIVHSSLADGNNFDLSSVRTTLHLGAHADSPSHYERGGEGIGSRSLNYYYGDCQVISVDVEFGSRVFPDDIVQAIEAPRILLKTGTFPDSNNWNANFSACSPDLIYFLHERGCCLIGIDTPSVDLQNDEELLSHQAVAHCDMAILEGLSLDLVSDGVYVLCAFPLRLKDADASPVRAVLIQE